MRHARAIVGGYGSPRAVRASAVASSWLSALIAGAAGFFALTNGLGVHGVLATGAALTAVLFGGLAVHATLPPPAPRRAAAPRPSGTTVAVPRRHAVARVEPVPAPWPPQVERPVSPDAAVALADLERECGELARVARGRRGPEVTVAA